MFQAAPPAFPPLEALAHNAAALDTLDIDLQLLAAPSVLVGATEDPFVDSYQLGGSS